MTNGDTWFSLEITAAPEAAEAIEFALNSLDAAGTAINHLRKANTETVTVIGYFNELPDDQIVQDELHYALRSYGFGEESVPTVVRGEIENADWLAEWKKHWKPTEVGRFVIAPPWETVTNNEKIIIRIEPNMAFGTGTHETTQLCIAEIDRHLRSGESFLDVGTGTGILAIAAARLGSEAILACDTDTDSIKIAKENAELNGVAEKIEFYVGTITAAAPLHDFVCANLTIDVILPILDLLIDRSERILLLSGILSDQESMIADALAERGISSFAVSRRGEWISVLIVRS